MEERQGQKIYKIVMLIIITALLTVLITTTVLYRFVLKDNSTIKIEGDSSDIGYTLSSFRNIIDKYYLGEVDEEKLEVGAIKGYIAGLDDPYTQYFTKEEMTEYEEETMGKFTGIGIYMVQDEEQNVIRVLSPIKDSPAAEAGIEPGDIITKINDISYTGEQMNEASNKIKGENGSKVKLEILRGDQTLTFEIERREIKVNHVESKILENNIGYLLLTTFDDGCSEEFEEKLKELKKKNIQSLIIDLRNNGGGIVQEATNIADLFVDKGKDLLITTDKNNKEEITKAKKEKLIDVPVIILTNENTASASEILAGALKDHQAAKTVGTKTYGKGVIQELLTLSDGSGIKITTNEYYTPNRGRINKVGIEPDETVELPEEYKNKLEVPEDQDTQLQKAIEILKNN